MFFFLFAVHFVIFSLRATILIGLNLNLNLNLNMNLKVWGIHCFGCLNNPEISGKNLTSINKGLEMSCLTKVAFRRWLRELKTYLKVMTH